jgi:photosystem II stability/assembly factor-like uncharacterized protein
MKLIIALITTVLISTGLQDVTQQSLDSSASLRGLSVVSDEVAWLSGAHGTVGRTTDGGKTWQVIKVPGAEKLDFRDVEAFDDKRAYILSIGPGELSRIYHTADGGATWKQQWKNDDKNWTATETPILAGKESAGIFSIAFRDDMQGIIVGGDYQQPKQTQATAAITNDAGKTWKLIDQPLPFLSAVTWANGRWVAAGTAGIYTSTDGTTWKQWGEQNCNAIRLSKRGTGWAVGPQGKVFRISQK